MLRIWELHSGAVATPASFRRGEDNVVAAENKCKRVRDVREVKGREMEGSWGRALPRVARIRRIRWRVAELRREILRAWGHDVLRKERGNTEEVRDYL